MRHYFLVCKPWLEQQKRKLVDNSCNEDTQEVELRTPSQLTTSWSQNSASVVVEPKVQTLLVSAKNAALGFVNPGLNFSHLRGLIDDWVTVCEIPFEAWKLSMGIISVLQII